MSKLIETLFETSVVGEPTPGEDFCAAVSDCLNILWERFPHYAEFLERRSPGVFNRPLESLADVQKLPAMFLPILKQTPFPLPQDFTPSITLTSSGTSGQPSRIPLDAENMQRRISAMSLMYEAMGIVSGPTTAIAFLLDPATTQMAGSLVIDGVLRAHPQVNAISYLAKMSETGPAFDSESANLAITKAKAQGAVLCVGYPALITAAIGHFKKTGIETLPLSDGSLVLTGGGWKSFLPGVQIDQSEFRDLASDFFQLPKKNIRDMYGMAECPAVFVQCEQGGYHVPGFTWAQAIDPETGDEVSTGEIGLLQLTTPLTTSYPLLKILTTDKIAINPGCPCGIPAPVIIPKGRVTAARFETCAMKIGQAVSSAASEM